MADRPKSIALIDLSYLFKKRYHTTTDGVPLSAAKKTLQDLESLKRGVDHVIICRDKPPYKRLEVYAEYKSNRPEPEPEETAQRRWLAAEVKRLGFNVAFCQGYEADDVMATLARIYGEWCADVRIVGPDKDMAQCVTLSNNVVQFIPPHGERDWQLRNWDAVIEKFGVAPPLMPLWQALCGDSGDNVPGVPGIGPKKATELCLRYDTLARLAGGMAEEARLKNPPKYVTALAEHWQQLTVSLQLVTLDTNVPIDAESYLVKHTPVPEAPKRNDMDIEVDGYVGNETPMPAAPPADEVKPSEVHPVAQQAYREKFPANDSPPVAPKVAKDAEFEEQYDRERQRNEEHDTVSNTPGDKRAVPAQPKPRPAVSTALATAPTVTQHSKYGLVTADLQPLDLTAAYSVSEWLVNGGLYPQFKTPAQVFTIIARGKELGIGMTTALAGHHMVDNKPTASADLIRALVERDPNFDYLMPIEMSATKVVWEGKHKRHPRPVTFTYTIEEAKQAGLVRKTSYGKESNWMLRPQDMLTKTAGSKLARLLWPGATIGLYCPEELGYGEDELKVEAA